MDLMIDIETLATDHDALILTVAAQAFDPLGQGYVDRHYYARVDFESQPNRKIDEGTVEWWGRQPEASREEALGEADRKPLSQVLDELGKLIWQSDRLWAQGPTFDMTILENAYKENNMNLPWQYYKVRDSRTVFGLWSELPKPPVSHHALEDCRRQIELLQATLQHLNIKEIR